MIWALKSLDVGHVNANSSKPLCDWIKGLNHKIGYVHLHNNDGIHDNHYGLGKGQIDMLAVLEALKIYAPDASWSIETADLEQSVEWLDQKGFLRKRAGEQWTS